MVQPISVVIDKTRFCKFNLSTRQSHLLCYWVHKTESSGIYLYLQPFSLGLVSLFSRFVPLLRWFVGTFLLGIFPDGFQYHACFSFFFFSILLTWLNTFTLLRTSSLVMNSFHLMLRRLLKWTDVLSMEQVSCSLVFTMRYVGEHLC